MWGGREGHFAPSVPAGSWDCWLTPALLLHLLPGPAAVGTCAPAHPLERGWVVPGWLWWGSRGSREPGVDKVAMGRGWAGSASTSAPEFDSLKGTLVTSCCKRISCSNRHCHVRKSE